MKTIHARAYRLLIDRLREARKQAGLSQRAFADRLGRPYSFVAKYETYERLLDPIEFLELAIELEIDPFVPLRESLNHITRPSRRRART